MDSLRQVGEIFWDLRYTLLLIFGSAFVAHLLAWALDRIGRAIGRGWQRLRYSTADINEVDRMSGLDFERYLAHLFHKAGFGVQLTPASGDFGADLILIHPASGERIAVQAKRYKEAVGIRAVQEVHLGRTYYQCSRAIVVTTADFTPAAIEAAAATGVVLIDRERLTGMIEQIYRPAQKQAA